ncbi:S-adenosylmethionine decarboxylase proenzyme [Ethanoligenens harbinense YUAN-3]|uniref:S-adenosylmethionine decarboxylase proenzyme n=2 Tax=Ethanoligenens harbinense TaxID=253239 RepID=E6U8R3_ETHHY|nr:S-adenosylmethionine decarboxylase proenzyme [Ethanoligenens harbinense YUAN-3]
MDTIILLCVGGVASLFLEKARRRKSVGAGPIEPDFNRRSMIRGKMENRIKLYGFNNLTKSLSFNMYDICYAKTVEDRNAYLSYIDEQYNAERLTDILKHLTQIIGATVLNIAKQDYDPQGASVALLICEEPMLAKRAGDTQATPGPAAPGPASSETVLAHLDKSHITVHTYPEYHPDGGVCTFRVDIDMSTCGEITPLKALHYLINSFEADIMTIDYRVRGFTRDITGKKLFMEHPMTSIQNYIPREIREQYQMIDVNVYQDNIFHTKCKLREFDLDNYLFGYKEKDIHPGEAQRVTRKLQKEMDEIFYGRNMVDFHV